MFYAWLEIDMYIINLCPINPIPILEQDVHFLINNGKAL